MHYIVCDSNHMLCLMPNRMAAAFKARKHTGHGSNYSAAEHLCVCWSPETKSIVASFADKDACVAYAQANGCEVFVARRNMLTYRPMYGEMIYLGRFTAPSPAPSGSSGEASAPP